MDGRVDGWEYGVMEGWGDERTDGWMDGWMGWRKRGRKGEWVGGWLDGWMETGWIFGFIDSWVKPTVNNYSQDHLRPHLK